MTMTRVDPSRIRDSAHTRALWKEDVGAMRVDALRLASGASSYEGQCGPQVQAIGDEAIARLKPVATASHIRSVADQGAGTGISKIPHTDQSFPGLDLQAHSQNSASWPADNIRALASEYTTLPWDNGASADWPGCGYFVLEVYHDVVGSGALK